MGLLTCRRPKKLEESTATADDAPSPVTQRAAPGPIQAEIPLSEEQACVPDLQSLFQPPPSPLEDPRPIISLDGLSSNQDASPSAKVRRARERRRPLEVFSGRIRRGLSRESKFPSRLSRRQDKHRIRSFFRSVESTAASGSFAQECSLGSGLVSDRAYDSDAQYISTPKGSGQLAEPGSAGKSSRKSPKSLPDVLEAALEKPSEPSHIERIEEGDTPFNSQGNENITLDSTGDNRLVSASTTDLPSSREASARRTSANEESLQELTKLVENKPSTALRTADDATSETSDEQARHADVSLEASERREIQSSTRMKPGRDAIRSDGNAECRIGRSVTCPLALTGSQNSLAESQLLLRARGRRGYSTPVERVSERNSIHLCDMDISKRLAPSSVTPVGLSQDQSSGSNQRIAHSNFGSAVSHGHEDLEAVALELGSTRLVQTNNRGRDASSVYLSQTSSLPPSRAGSSNRLQLKTPGPVYTEDRITLPKRRGSGTGLRCYSPLHSELPSLIQQSNITGTETPTTGEHSPVPESKTAQSKFTEQLEASSASIPDVLLVQPDGDPNTARPRRVSVGWMSGGRRLGYGYSFVANSGDEGPTLQPRSDMPTVAPGIPSPSSRSWSLPTGQNKTASPTGDSTSAGNRRGVSSGAWELKSREAGELQSLWTRFTSHTRAERNGSAGPEDDVAVRDFYTGPNSETATRRVPSGFDLLLERMRLKRRSQRLHTLNRRAT
ncbi:hypothetical protein VTN02DRAFT_4807 [Thermoascus thermophilus]